MSNTNLTLSNIKKMIDKFNTTYPRSKIPNYVYANKKTIELIKIYFKPIIKHGSPDFLGLPIYERDIPDNEVRIYNLNNELMRTLIFKKVSVLTD